METTPREYKSPRKRFCRQHLATLAAPINQSINQSKFIFHVITEKLQCNNVVALEMLPEKHYAH